VACPNEFIQAGAATIRQTYGFSHCAGGKINLPIGLLFSLNTIGDSTAGVRNACSISQGSQLFKTSFERCCDGVAKGDREDRMALKILKV